MRDEDRTELLSLNLNSSFHSHSTLRHIILDSQNFLTETPIAYGY